MPAAAAPPRPVVVLLTALVMVAALVMPAPRAAAHDVLVGSSPADGETLTEAPTEVVLTFSDELLDSTSAILVADASGGTVAEGSPTVDGATATLTMDPLPDGDYTVTWSVVSGDGHRIEGEYPFTVSAGASTPDRSEEATTPAAEETTATPDEASTPEDTASGDDGADGPPLVLPTWVGVLVAIAILAGLVGTIVSLRRRR